MDSDRRRTESRASQPSVSSSAVVGANGRSPLPFVQPPDKSGRFQFLHEACINETLRIDRRGLWRPWRHVIEQGFYAFGVWIGNLGKRGVVGLVSPFQALRVVCLEILSDERFGIFFMGLDVMQRFCECPHNSRDQ